MQIFVVLILPHLVDDARDSGISSMHLACPIDGHVMQDASVCLPQDAVPNHLSPRVLVPHSASFSGVKWKHVFGCCDSPRDPSPQIRAC